METVSVLRFVLFKDSEKSFLSALDAEGIGHERVHQFTTQPQASGIVEAISTLSEAMPWNSIAKVMVAWIEARKSRKIIITTDNNQIIHMEGYSIEDVKKILPKTINITIIDTKPENEI